MRVSGRAAGRWIAVAAVAAVLAGCGGSPAAVAPPENEGVPVAQAPEMVSDAPTMPDPAQPAAAETPALAPIVVQPSGAIAADDPGATVPPAAPSTTDPAAAPATTDPAPAQPATTDPVPATTDPAPAQPATTDPVPATTDPAPAQPATTDPVPATTDPAPATTDPAPATTDPPPAAPGGEVSPGMSGRPGSPAIEITDGMSALIESGDNGRKEVALTFDAGADTGYAPAILDLLRDEGISATFGMTGTWAENNPDLIVRMVKEGHQLINHTYTHDSLTGANTGKPAMTFEQLADELDRTERIVRDLTGYELAPYFRPPYGDYDATTLTWLHDLGYPYTIMWTCDTRGWAGWTGPEIIDYCTRVPLEDDIILMHVGASAAGDYEALPGLIAWYRDNGYAFVTAERMLQP